MAFKRTEYPDGSWTEDYTGSELEALLNERPLGVCSYCERKTWVAEMIGRRCYLTQPDGQSCAGVFHAW